MFKHKKAVMSELFKWIFGIIIFVSLVAIFIWVIGPKIVSVVQSIITS
ncbi:hypothetical protein J4434_00950 [Candidatus Woesearchaeota archaeon]|nr:hypothetical protein [Candidatus Woesearchaeota archaeon]